MDKFLTQAFKNLPVHDVPNDAHAAILRAAFFSKSWRYVQILTGVLGLMFIISLWHLYTRSVETESIFTIKTVADTFDLSFDSVVDSARTLADALPVQAMLISLLNFVALICMTFVLLSFSRIQNQFKIQYI